MIEPSSNGVVGASVILNCNNFGVINSKLFGLAKNSKTSGTGLGMQISHVSLNSPLCFSIVGFVYLILLSLYLPSDFVLSL